MRKAFISYARANKHHVNQLVEHLSELGCQTWLDSSLHGGQDWWAEILRRIAECDVFIAIVSHEALNSVACQREFDWAEALGKPVLPVAVETPPTALPRRFSIRQIVDYSEPGHRDRAAVRLGGGLASLPPAPPVPKPLPRPPAAPLSYLTDLIELVHAPSLSHDQQRHVLVKLEPALRSVDPEERRGGRVVLEKFGSRDDLFADVDRTITILKQLNDQAGTRPKPNTPGIPVTPQKPTAQKPTADRRAADRTRPSLPGPPNTRRLPGPAPTRHYAPPSGNGGAGSAPRPRAPSYSRPIALAAASAFVVVVVAFLAWRIVTPDSSGTTPDTTTVPTWVQPTWDPNDVEPTNEWTPPEETPPTGPSTPEPSTPEPSTPGPSTEVPLGAALPGEVPS